MCGLFGFIGNKPNPQILHQCIEGASTRGPHAYGYLTDDDYFKSVRLKAFSSGQLLKSVQNSPITIGHFRLATSGTWKVSKNNQPIVVGPVAIAHNGRVLDDHRLQSKDAPETPSRESACDSEILASLVVKYLAHPEPSREQTRDAVHYAIADLPADTPLALLVKTHNHIAAIRRGTNSLPAHPLYTGWYPEGVYFSSRSFPNGCLMPVDDVFAWSRHDV